MNPSPIRVAIQGDRASFHEIAANKHFTGPITLLYCQTFEEVFTQLINGDADRAFVAVSNSSHGTIKEVARLIKTYPVTAEATHQLAIEQHIISSKPIELSEIKEVISHPVALSQCSLYLKSVLPHSKPSDYHDTSAAVEYIKMRNDPSVVAIGSEAAAELHGMHILKRAVQDDPRNATTFTSFVLQR